MRAWILGIILVAGYFLALDASNVSAYEQPYNPAGIYATHCAQCHGKSGSGDGPQAKSLNHRPHTFRDCGWMTMMSDASIFLVIKEGSAAGGFDSDMPGYGGTLNDDQIVALINYVRSFCREGTSRAAAPSFERTAPPPGSPP